MSNAMNMMGISAYYQTWRSALSSSLPWCWIASGAARELAHDRGPCRIEQHREANAEMTPMEQKGYRLWGKIVDGTLSLPVANGVVVTAGERIAWVGEAERLPRELKGDDYADVRLPGRTVMPGLVDGRTHISFGEASLKKQRRFERERDDHSGVRS